MDLPIPEDPPWKLAGIESLLRGIKSLTSNQNDSVFNVCEMVIVDLEFCHDGCGLDELVSSRPEWDKPPLNTEDEMTEAEVK